MMQILHQTKILCPGNPVANALMTHCSTESLSTIN